jgi:hypothetical protein
MERLKIKIIFGSEKIFVEKAANEFLLKKEIENVTSIMCNFCGGCWSLIIVYAVGIGLDGEEQA